MSDLETQLRTIAVAVRASEERYWLADELDPTWTVGLCHSMSEALVTALRSAGFDATLARGYYRDVEESYVSIVARKQGVDFVPSCDEFDGTWQHWWVVCEGRILDISADQFHPSERESYAVVLVNIGDSPYSTAWK